jgi:hypothetical protein
VLNHPMILFDGINRSRYSMAPSTRISIFSPGAGPYGSLSRGALSLSADTSLALRGAPCGDDPRLRDRRLTGPRS